MAARSKNSNLQAAIDNSVRQEIKEDVDNGGSLLFMLAGQNGAIAPWWSRRRDVQLRELLKQSDHLSGAMYDLCTKIAAIPLRITPKDRSIHQHVILADEYTDYFRNYTEFGAGWEHFISKWVEEYHSQDNGAFVEFVADGASMRALALSGTFWVFVPGAAPPAGSDSPAKYPVLSSSS